MKHLTDIPEPWKRKSTKGVLRPHIVNGHSSSYDAETVKRIGEMIEDMIPRKQIARRVKLTEGQVIGICTKHNFRYKKMVAMLHIDITMPKELHDKATSRAFFLGKPLTTYVRMLIERDIK